LGRPLGLTVAARRVNASICPRNLSLPQARCCSDPPSTPARAWCGHCRAAHRPTQARLRRKVLTPFLLVNGSGLAVFRGVFRAANTAGNVKNPCDSSQKCDACTVLE
jgi:hypothetical protein